MAIFPTFFLANIGQETVFYDILEQKNAFLGYKNKKFKKSKHWDFSKGGNAWFWSKNSHFSNSVLHFDMFNKHFEPVSINQSVILIREKKTILS